ncbi:unnamed protein product [Dracunculus medinensis]|uniref:GDSL esterase/lipase n=1 Tax=Dracunculus medinensis TaxID=318479 RepID=A0A0N4U436_DRAME|nr:unnamed protein product [Dracunculus medinensis]
MPGSPLAIEVQGALDVLTSVPDKTSDKVTINTVAPLLPPAARQLSRIFHIPHDFMHRLAAQSGYIDYNPNTTPPSDFLNDLMKQNRLNSFLPTERLSTNEVFINNNRDRLMKGMTQFSQNLSSLRSLWIFPNKGFKKKLLAMGDS